VIGEHDNTLVVLLSCTIKGVLTPLSPFSSDMDAWILRSTQFQANVKIQTHVINTPS